jgi:hypothetical protein
MATPCHTPMEDVQNREDVQMHGDTGMETHASMQMHANKQQHRDVRMHGDTDMELHAGLQMHANKQMHADMQMTRARKPSASVSRFPLGSDGDDKASGAPTLTHPQEAPSDGQTTSGIGVSGAQIKGAFHGVFMDSHALSLFSLRVATPKTALWPFQGGLPKGGGWSATVLLHS